MGGLSELLWNITINIIVRIELKTDRFKTARDFANR